MARLPVVSGRRAIRALIRAGFAAVAQKGSHVRLRGTRHGRMRVVVVPLHPEVAVGTLRSILRQAAMTAEEFEGLL
ncbi:MAG TPA: type II toxin-antitoxin system HicA family toxin [Candidatus Thermoplasmatota archaeon]|nr:type II toxin-antitoxin system HicA family toxin [Candidatus Thermoplasmatota archaeon]